MSKMTIYADNAPGTPLFKSEDRNTITQKLRDLGVRFELWETGDSIHAGDSQEKVLAAFKTDIDRLVKEEGYLSMDVVSLDASHPKKAELRQKFLDEHSHNEDEVRFFVDGEGLFSLHVGDKVYEVLCRKGDLISVPAKTPHWFDMGPNPHFVAIRLFNNPDGWIAKFTGNDIAKHFPRLEN